MSIGAVRFHINCFRVFVNFGNACFLFPKKAVLLTTASVSFCGVPSYRERLGHGEQRLLYHVVSVKFFSFLEQERRAENGKSIN